MAGYFDNSKKKKAPRMSITSLMDVLTIILIFLLTNYSEEAPSAEISEDISLPIIEAKSERKKAAYEKEVKVTFSASKLEIGEDVISFKSFDHQREQVLDIAITKMSKHLSDLDPEKKGNTVVTLHADKDVTFHMIESLMRAAAASGITQIEFVGMFEQSKGS